MSTDAHGRSAAKRVMAIAHMSLRWRILPTNQPERGAEIRPKIGTKLMSRDEWASEVPRTVWRKVGVQVLNEPNMTLKQHNARPMSQTSQLKKAFRASEIFFFFTGVLLLGSFGRGLKKK